MDPREALLAVHSARRPEDVVITTMATARDWMTFPQNPLDVVFVPSAMSHATSMGLGIALAQPKRRVIVCNGDGSMLMNLGSLVSIVGAKATNLTVIVFDNGIYEVTGAQPVPASNAVDFATIARGAGFRTVDEFRNLEDWKHRAARTIEAPGPTFVWLRVAPVTGIPGPKSPGPAGERARRLREALGGSL
jgi:thiamine pyrophosphate-dependent acetolactate synthase large subunit-like protein